ncbi:MAG: CHASE2 domain-containing protein, partial [Myxococcota bacterium]|nr:CHASE2 domain-containing protein [Myxococcota bacterium]
DHGQIFAAARSGRYRPPGERVPALPSDLQDLIIRCMAPDRNGRPDSCAELLSVLRSIAASEGPQDRPLWTPPPLERGQPSAPPADQYPDTLASLVSHGDGPAHGNMAEQVPAAQTLANWGRNDPTPRVEQLPPWPAGFGTRREDAEPPQPAPPPNVPPETPPVAARRGAPGGDARQEPTPRVWRRGGGWRAGLLLLPLLAATLSWTGNADARLTWWILDAYRAPVVADDVGLIAISVDDPIALRPDYPGMLRALRDAGVRAVVFDVALTRPSPHDAAIAEAIDELDDAGVPVVFPIRFSGSDAEPPASPEIREAATLGLVESSRGSGAGLVYQLESRRFLPDSATVWHLALHGAAAAQGLGPDEIAVEGDDLQVGEHRVPAPGRLLWLTPTTAPRYVPHDAPDRFPELEGRVAFVGAHGRNRDEFLTPAGIRYGVEIIAMMTQAILSEAIPRRLGTGAVVLAAALAGLMSLVAGGQRKWLGWMVALGLMSVAVAACISGILVALVPLVSAALIGAWAGQGGRPR